MVRIHVVTRLQQCQKAVEGTVLHASTTPVFSVAFKQTCTEKPGDIVLMQLYTLHGDAFLFDIKSCPQMMHQGHLWRILQTSQIIKVMHDCRSISSALKRQFGVTLDGVFDTQAAYCMILMQLNLPARMVHPYTLYEKFGDTAQRLMPQIKEHYSVTEAGGIFWAQRPMTRPMINAAAIEVQALLPAVYDNVQRELIPTVQLMLEELIYAYMHGKFRKNAFAKSELPKKDGAKKPTIQLTDKQKFLLSGTLTPCQGHPKV